MSGYLRRLTISDETEIYQIYLDTRKASAT